MHTQVIRAWKAEMPRAKIVMEKIKRQKAVKETVAKNMENLLNGTLPYYYNLWALITPAQNRRYFCEWRQ